MKLKTAIFVLLTILFALGAFEESTQQEWTRIELSEERQASQMEAGYQNGCEITAILYALKFGPTGWRLAYKNISGANDIQKIQSLAAKFNSMPSQKSKGQPAFSEKYGTNPNDVPWMIQSLMQSQLSLSLTKYFLSPQADLSQRKEVLKKFQLDLSQRLEVGQPILMDRIFLGARKRT